jgi:peptide/nickel transport system substrate-binding protein
VAHGRHRRQEELTRLIAGWARSSFVENFQRRTATRLRCGVVLFSAAVAVGCTGSEKKASSGQAVLTIGVTEAIAGADFSLQNLASNLSLEGLAQLSSDGRALPKLAESWTWASDGLALRVDLRKGIAFHDGTPLTAKVVSEILMKAISKPSNRAQYTSFRDIADVHATGDLQLTFELSRRSSFLPEDLELPLEIGNPGVGTGAYRVVKREPSEVVLQANDNYYLGAPGIRQVILRPFGVLRNGWSSLLRGEVDMVTEVPPDAVEFVTNDAVQVVSFGRRYQYVVAFNSRRPPFNSAILRRALNLAIDRPALIRSVLQGHASPSTGPLWPQHWAYDSSVPAFGYDPALAMSILENSGFHERPTQSGPPARLRFTCLIPANFSIIERLGLNVQKQLYDIGVDMQFEVVRAEDLDARIRVGHFDAFLIELLGGPSLSRAYMFWASARSFQGLNVFGYENPQAERLFGVLRTTTNEGAIRSTTRSLQQVLLDDPPALFLTWNQRSRAVRRDFQIVQDATRDPADPMYTIWKWNHVVNEPVATH